jgi:hypothetical protein
MRMLALIAVTPKAGLAEHQMKTRYTVLFSSEALPLLGVSGNFNRG